MARRLVGVSLVERDDLPVGCAGCLYWESVARLPRLCGAVCDEAEAAAALRLVTDEWGESGRAVVEDGQALGFIRYVPPRYAPQAAFLPSGPPDPALPLITCMHIAAEARRLGLGGVLLRAALRDLAQRGHKRVQAFATTASGELEDEPMPGVAFLLRHGFTVVRAHPEVPLLQLDLRSLVSWAENLEALLESLRIPVRPPARSPATLAKDR